MSECTHTREVPGRWVPNPYHDPEEWECGGYDTGPDDWEDGYEESTTEDVDLHRYRCTQCDKIFYYSSRARDHYENGTSYPEISGLE